MLSEPKITLKINDWNYFVNYDPPVLYEPIYASTLAGFERVIYCTLSLNSALGRNSRNSLKKRKISLVYPLDRERDSGLKINLSV